MPEKLKMLIKPLAAAAAAVIVLVIAYFSGSDVSKNDKPEIKASDTASVTSVTEQTLPVTETASVTTAVTAGKTSSVSTTATSAQTLVSRSKRTTATETKTETVTTPETTMLTTTATGTTTVTEPITTPAVSEKQHSQCRFSISCATVFDNRDKIDAAILAEQPSNGFILAPTNIEVNDGDSVFDILKRVCDGQGIPIEYTKIAATNNYYIEGINNLYEFDAGNLSGWMYSVNGKFPQLSSSQYAVSDGDVIEFVYSCNIGVDVGDDYYTKAG